MWWLLTSMALAGTADITAEAFVQAPSELAFETTIESKNLVSIYPEDCAIWMFPAFRGDGHNAYNHVIYVAAGMRRQLTAFVANVYAPHHFEFDHPGKVGFTTRFSFYEEEGGTRIFLTTYMNEPPWPLRKYFENRVKPVWADCHQRTIANAVKSIEAAQSQGDQP